MNIILGISLLILFMNSVAAAPGPLTASEARPDTFVVAKIPGSYKVLLCLFTIIQLKFSQRIWKSGRTMEKNAKIQ